MGRNVGDAALMLDAESGLHPRDPISYASPSTPYVEAVDNPVRPAKVAFTPNLGVAPVEPEVVDICTQAVQLFETIGAEVEEDTIDLHDASPTFQTLRAAGFAAGMKSLFENRRDQLKPEIIWNIEKGLALSTEEFADAERARGALFQRTADFFDRYDLLLSPAVAVPPFDVDIRYVTEIDGVQMDNYIDWALLTSALTLTACPAISVPCGFTEAGLPVGLQIMAPHREEARLLSAALFEEATGLADLVPLDPRVSA